MGRISEEMGQGQGVEVVKEIMRWEDLGPPASVDTACWRIQGKQMSVLQNASAHSQCFHMMLRRKKVFSDTC